MVEFIHGVVALLAGLILVLTALVGWLYLQQSRMSHAINALAVAVTAPPPSFMYTNELPQQEQAVAAEDDDDRLSVHDLDAPAPSEHIVEQVEQVSPDVATVSAPPPSADDDITGKTVAQLRDMLTAKGIPFNKSDKKTTLVSLVQVSA